MSQDPAGTNTLQHYHPWLATCYLDMTVQCLAGVTAWARPPPLYQTQQIADQVIYFTLHLLAEYGVCSLSAASNNLASSLPSHDWQYMSLLCRLPLSSRHSVITTPGKAFIAATYVI